MKVTRDNWTSINYDGAVICLGGDLFSGDIHEELKETNEDTILGSLDFWLDHLGAGLSMIADEFGAEIAVKTVRDGGNYQTAMHEAFEELKRRCKAFEAERPEVKLSAVGAPVPITDATKEKKSLFNTGK